MDVCDEMSEAEWTRRSKANAELRAKTEAEFFDRLEKLTGGNEVQGSAFFTTLKFEEREIYDETCKNVPDEFVDLPLSEL